MIFATPIFASTMRDLNAVFSDLPTIPGKATFLILGCLSIILWAIIFSKSIQLSSLRNADKRFRRKLKRSKTCLEIFESGNQNSFHPSPLFQIYESGASETVAQIRKRKRERGTSDLNHHQLNGIGEAFARGEREVGISLIANLRWLKPFIFTPVLFGFLASCWIVFESILLNGGQAIGSAFGYSLILMLGAFGVSIPAIFARNNLVRQARSRAIKFKRFRGQVFQIFQNHFEVPQEDFIRPEVADIFINDEQDQHSPDIERQQQTPPSPQTSHPEPIRAKSEFGVVTETEPVADLVGVEAVQTQPMHDIEVVEIEVPEPVEQPQPIEVLQPAPMPVAERIYPDVNQPPVSPFELDNDSEAESFQPESLPEVDFPIESLLAAEPVPAAEPIVAEAESSIEEVATLEPQPTPLEAEISPQLAGMTEYESVTNQNWVHEYGGEAVPEFDDQINRPKPPPETGDGYVTANY